MPSDEKRKESESMEQRSRFWGSQIGKLSLFDRIKHLVEFEFGEGFNECLRKEMISLKKIGWRSLFQGKTFHVYIQKRGNKLLLESRREG